MVVTEPADGMPAAPMAMAVAVMLNSKKQLHCIVNIIYLLMHDPFVS